MHPLWPAAPESPPPLVPGWAHVYFLPLDFDAAPGGVPDALAYLHSLLSDGERERAARFLVEPPRQQFIASHAQMRQILNGYAQNGDIFGQNGPSEAKNRPPAASGPQKSGAVRDLRFETLPQGKPYIPGSRLRFNLSHTTGAALLAVVLDRELGVDIESIDRTVDYAQIAPRFFAPSEAEALLALPPDQRQSAFFRCWTRKEAFIKAVGGGLSIPLDSFTVTFAPGQPALLDAPANPGWTLYALDPHPRYAAALVVEGALAGMQCWTWSALP